MSPPIPADQRCGRPISKHDGTGRTTYCALMTGHKHTRHRDEDYLEMRRRTDTEDRRLRYRSQNYGMPESWYRDRLAVQGGGCAICRKTPEQNGKALAIDHDHLCCPTKARSCGSCVRGLLCDDCNQLLARARDRREILLAAAAYLS